MDQIHMLVILMHFTIPWPQSVYAFPPINLVQKFLSNFIDQKIEYGLLISPFWPSQPYFPTLLSLLIDNPLIFSASLVENPATLPPNLSYVMASYISSSSVLHTEFLLKQPAASSEVWKQQPFAHTCVVGNYSQIVVLNKKSILATYV